MKKIIALLTITAIIVTGGFVGFANSSGYDPSEYTGYSDPSFMHDPEGLDPATVLQIRRDFRAQLINDMPQNEFRLSDIWISWCLGNYSGHEVMFMEHGFDSNADERRVQVAGYTVRFSSSQEVYIYNAPNFYTLVEAYDLGLITREDVYAIGSQIGFAEDYNNLAPYADVEDALAILRHLVGLPSTATLEMHNFTGSGELEVEDALLILRGIVGIGERQRLPI
jgi:hypothetical protein